MAKINQIEAVINGEKKQFYLEDKDTAASLADLKLTVSKLDGPQLASTLDAVKKSVENLTEVNTETEAKLTDYDERITKAQNTADSNAQKYSALSAVVDSNTQKISDEIERAKAVEGERDQLTASDNETLVAAINWVQTRAEKAIENVGTLADLTTSEKTDVVLAINELDRQIETNKTNIATNATAITTETANRTTAVSNEETARKSADSALESKISALLTPVRLGIKTLAAGETSLSWTNDVITDTCIIEPSCSVNGVAPTAQEQSGTTYTVTFDAQSADMQVDVVVIP